MTSGIDSIVFDLDGTLWDTCAACARGWNNVVARHGFAFPKVTAADVRKVTGRPHEACIRDTFTTLNDEQIEILIAETAIEDNLMVAEYGGDLYPGVASGLEELASRRRLFIVSNCQSGYIETFLSWTGFGPFFFDVECWGNTRRPKGENLADLIRRNGLERPIMVGDMESDRQAAEFCNIPFWHVTYGFGKVSKFDRAFESFDGLRKALQ